MVSAMVAGAAWRSRRCCRPSCPAVPIAATGCVKSQARLTPYGRESVVGRLAADDAANEKAWKELPPLTDYQDLGELRPGAIVLLEAVTPDGKTAPLLVTQRYGRGATWLLATASTWHWQMSLPKEDQRHETFWKQLLYTLVAPAPAHVSLQPERSVYEDGTAVTLEAEVLDESFMPVPEAELKVEAKAPDGDDVPARIEPSGRGDGRYTVAVDAREPGLYQVRLTATAGGETVGEAADTRAPRRWRARTVRLVAASADAGAHCQGNGRPLLDAGRSGRIARGHPLFACGHGRELARWICGTRRWASCCWRC